MPTKPRTSFVIIALTSALLVLEAPRAARAQSTPEFETCSWWQHTGAEFGEAGDLYRLGFAQGMTVGVLADLRNYLKCSPQETEGPVSRLVQNYYSGFTTLVNKPALMKEALTAKCNDYRNAAVHLHDLAFLAALEIGGAAPDRIEGALQVLRRQPGSGQADLGHEAEVIAALIAR